MLIIDLPPSVGPNGGCLSFTYEAALILVLLREYQSLRKAALDEKLVGLGLDPKGPRFKSALKKMRRTGALIPKSYPNYVPSYMGRVFGQTIELYLRTKQRAPTYVPSAEVLAAFMRLSTPVNLTDELGLAGGYTFDEARDLHEQTSASDRAINVPFDEWLEIACTTGLGFWYEGRIYLLTMTDATQLMVLRGCKSLNIHAHEDE